jgi:hypothetical protein
MKNAINEIIIYYLTHIFWEAEKDNNEVNLRL